MNNSLQMGPTWSSRSSRWAVSFRTPRYGSGVALALGYANSFPDSRCDLTLAVQPLVYAVGDCDPWVAFHAAKALWFFWKSDERCDLEANESWADGRFSGGKQ